MSVCDVKCISFLSGLAKTETATISLFPLVQLCSSVPELTNRQSVYDSPTAGHRHPLTMKELGAVVSIIKVMCAGVVAMFPFTEKIKFRT